MIDTNLELLLQHVPADVIDGMRERSFGRIVNIGSINGQAGQYGQVNYAAAKSGIHGFTKALAQEGAAKGITVNAIAPGYIDTDMVRAVPPNVLEKIVAQIPVGRLGKAVGDRARRAVPGRRRGRLHHRLDAVDQRRPAHVLRLEVSHGASMPFIEEADASPEVKAVYDDIKATRRSTGSTISGRCWPTIRRP